MCQSTRQVESNGRNGCHLVFVETDSCRNVFIYVHANIEGFEVLGLPEATHTQRHTETTVFISLFLPGNMSVYMKSQPWIQDSLTLLQSCYLQRLTNNMNNCTTTTPPIWDSLGETSINRDPSCKIPQGRKYWRLLDTRVTLLVRKV